MSSCEVNDLDHDISSIHSVPVVNEFQDVFPDNFLGVPPPREIDFNIDLEPNTKPISIPSYRMRPVELKDSIFNQKISLRRV